MKNLTSFEEEKKVEDQVRFLEFDLGEESYAVKLLSVREVITVPEMTPLPNGPSYFNGIMNLRGQIISVVDLRKKLNIKKSDASEEAVVIIDIDGISIGMVVDTINKVLSFALEELVEIPEVRSQVNAKYIQGVYRNESKLTLLLDVESIFDLDNIKKLSNIAA